MWPHRRQPTRLPCPWDSPGKNTGVGCHFFLQCVKVKVKSLSRVRLLATPWTAAYQALLPLGFSRQEYWSGVSLLSPKESENEEQIGRTIYAFTAFAWYAFNDSIWCVHCGLQSKFTLVVTEWLLPLLKVRITQGSNIRECLNEAGTIVSTINSWVSLWGSSHY